MKAYYAHCKAIYGTPQETRDILLLMSLGFDVLNPADEQYEEGWQQKGMDYARTLMSQCRLLAFRGLPDGKIPCGVFTEIRIAEKGAMPIIELPSGIRRRGLDLDQTREYLVEVGQR